MQRGCLESCVGVLITAVGSPRGPAAGISTFLTIVNHVWASCEPLARSSIMLNLSLSSFHAPLPRDIFPLLEPLSVRDTKDPCPVFDGKKWHLFGSAGSVIREEWLIFH